MHNKDYYKTLLSVTTYAEENGRFVPLAKIRELSGDYYLEILHELKDAKVGNVFRGSDFSIKNSDGIKLLRRKCIDELEDLKHYDSHYQLDMLAMKTSVKTSKKSLKISALSLVVSIISLFLSIIY